MITKPIRLLMPLTAVLFTVMPSVAQSVNYELIPVGDPGNAADTTGYGAVPDPYQIGKYEVTIGQYTEFLNAVAKTDTYSLYSTNMAGSQNVAGISRSGFSGSFTYSVMANFGMSGNRPITYVSYWDVARFANWMANGQPSGSQGPTTTENGAYDLSNWQSGTAPAMNATNPNTGATPLYRIPTENEWYKAAYYSPVLNSGSGGYYTYATQSNTAPGNTIGSAANQANYNNGVYATTQSSIYSGLRNYLTDVGAFTNSASFYGTFDQNGNVGEFNSLTGEANPVSGFRGGSWFGSSYLGLASTRGETNLIYGDDKTGFRLASPVLKADILFNIDSGTQTQGAAGYPLLTSVNAASVTKTGDGTVIFDAANTYTGPTSIQQGTLAITNTSAISSSSLVSLAAGASFDVSGLSGGYTVPSGQTIGGSGTILGSVTFGAGSTLSPGLSSGVSGAALLPSADQFSTPQTIAVPEPATLGMAGVGLGFLGLGALRRKRVA